MALNGFKRSPFEERKEKEKFPYHGSVFFFVRKFSPHFNFTLHEINSKL